MACQLDQIVESTIFTFTSLDKLCHTQLFALATTVG